ncbi:G domain-containing protein [Heracleum sosnowskyi]|uniref:G domain-containing protein n=1 Tax=Heracleum sosnowskyi TaxID=360622 RepID=A0AAD8JFK2_9APIA|nr:G domain-containing protein [Heracleum sosnowskyi]
MNIFTKFVTRFDLSNKAWQIMIGNLRSQGKIQASPSQCCSAGSNWTGTTTSGSSGSVQMKACYITGSSGCQIAMTLVFRKCDKMKGGKGKRPDDNIKSFQELIRESYKIHPPWIMMSSATGLGRDNLLLHMSQLRNYWDN